MDIPKHYSINIIKLYIYIHIYIHIHIYIYHIIYPNIQSEFYPPVALSSGCSSFCIKGVFLEVPTCKLRDAGADLIPWPKVNSASFSCQAQLPNPCVFCLSIIFNRSVNIVTFWRALALRFRGISETQVGILQLKLVALRYHR